MICRHADLRDICKGSLNKSNQEDSAVPANGTQLAVGHVIMHKLVSETQENGCADSTGHEIEQTPNPSPPTRSLPLSRGGKCPHVFNSFFVYLFFFCMETKGVQEKQKKMGFL